MRPLLHLLDALRPRFAKGGPWNRLHPLFEATDSFLFTSGSRTTAPPHLRDAWDLKRMMITVFIALIPSVLAALINTGHQANLLYQHAAPELLQGQWQTRLLQFFGWAPDAASLWSNLALGAVTFFPVYLVTLATGGFWEVLFALVRRHEITEGFLVTSLLFPLILPPTIPLWQVALGISFGVVIGKEVFGGVGYNVFNPALVGRAFLFFAYPAQISGERVWVAVDGATQATPLADIAAGQTLSGELWSQAFWGALPGSMGETSTLAILLGALILVATGVGSWRIMLSVLAGATATVLLLSLLGNTPLLSLTPWQHFLLGGFAFGTVFMATDPVSAAVTRQGKILYGLLIGVTAILVRVLNPAYPEGMMLAILFGNAFAPIFDWAFIRRNIKRRLARHAQ